MLELCLSHHENSICFNQLLLPFASGGLENNLHIHAAILFIFKACRLEMDFMWAERLVEILIL